MNRRRFVIGLGMCGALTVLFGCGPKEDAPESTDEGTPEAVELEGQPAQDERTVDETANVEELPGPSDYWRCAGCERIIKKARKVPPGTTVVGRVKCGGCGKAYSASDVYGGLYDLPEVKLNCPKCSALLRGPGEDLLGKPCPSCNEVLPGGTDN